MAIVSPIPMKASPLPTLGPQLAADQGALYPLVDLASSECGTCSPFESSCFTRSTGTTPSSPSISPPHQKARKIGVEALALCSERRSPGRKQDRSPESLHTNALSQNLRFLPRSIRCRDFPGLPCPHLLRNIPQQDSVYFHNSLAVPPSAMTLVLLAPLERLHRQQNGKLTLHMQLPSPWPRAQCPYSHQRTHQLHLITVLPPSPRSLPMILFNPSQEAEMAAQRARSVKRAHKRLPKVSSSSPSMRRRPTPKPLEHGILPSLMLGPSWFTKLPCPDTVPLALGPS